MFRSIGDLLPVGIFLTDTKGYCTYTNKRFQSLCDCAPEKVLHEGWALLIHPVDRGEIFADWSVYAREGRAYSREVRSQPAPGVIGWVHVRTAPIFSRDGFLIGHSGTAEDISERKESELALLQSENRYRVLVEQAADGIHTYDFEGNIIDVNTKFCEMLGYTREELLRLKVNDLIPAADLVSAPLRFDDLRAGKTIISERLILRKDGKLLPVEISGKMLPSSTLQAIIRDITKRKRAEDALLASEEWLRAIFDASRDGILVEDDERIIYVNKSYTSLFGYDSPEELIGRHVSVVISTEDVERMLEYGSSRAQGESVASVYEFKGKRKDGTLIDVEASVSSSTVAGRAYITTTVRDIAERKRAEEALRQAHDELERRVAERTVELANTNEKLQAEIRERTRMGEARRHLLQQLDTAQEDERRRISRELHDQMGQHLAAIVLLVNSLKDFPQLETATNSRFEQLEEVAQQISREVDTLAWELRPTVLDDVGLDAALANHLEKWSKRSGVSVDFHSTGLADRRLPPQIETAIYRLAQEALTNIIKHAQATNVGVILERRDGQVSVIIDDDGCGFAVESLLTTPAEGRRMGILGMQERTTLVGGTLNIESSPGAGTTIFVRIPLTQAGNEGNHHE